MRNSQQTEQDWLTLSELEKKYGSATAAKALAAAREAAGFSRPHPDAPAVQELKQYKVCVMDKSTQEEHVKKTMKTSGVLSGVAIVPEDLRGAPAPKPKVQKKKETDAQTPAAVVLKWSKSLLADSQSLRRTLTQLKTVPYTKESKPREQEGNQREQGTTHDDERDDKRWEKGTSKRRRRWALHFISREGG
jgi:hypothetical protein